MFAGCKSNRQVRNDKSHERPLKCESNRAKYRRTGGINPIHQPAWIKALTLAKLRSSVNNQSNPPKHARQSNNNRWGSPSSFGDLHRPSSSFGNLRKPSETFGDLWRPSRFFEVLRSGETLPPPPPHRTLRTESNTLDCFNLIETGTAVRMGAVRMRAESSVMNPTKGDQTRPTQ